MIKVSSIKQACITAVCIALCYVLPQAFHTIGLGNVFSPMHLPVLLCGMLCGGGYGCFCGIAGPLLSSVLSGMPGPTGLISMLPELFIYGLASGLLMKYIRTGKLYADLYIVLIAAMVLGRIVGGIVSACFYLGSGKTFTIAIWASSYFLGTLPGIISQLILIPILVVTLMKSNLITKRY